MPRAAADSRSDWSAMRLRSRQVTCMTGSTPAARASRLPAQLDSRACAPWPSVMLTASTKPRSGSTFRRTASGSAPRGGPTPGSCAARSLPLRRGCAPPDGRYTVGISGGPQLVVTALPVVDPRALPPASVVDGTLQQVQVGDPPMALRPLPGHQPHAPQTRVDLARTVAADPATGTVAQLLGAGHRARVPGDRQRALAAHPAAEKPALGGLLGGGEGPVPRR